MVNLFDIARSGGSGHGLETMSRQFGLDHSQTTRAVEALLPAFSLAFQRMSLNPATFADFLGSVGSGRYPSTVEPVSPMQAAATGSAVLEQLFKSPEAAQQVARQAAAMAGVGAQALQQMMPVLAAQLVGGMARYATAEGFADMLRQWAGALKLASDKIDPPRSQDPWSAWQNAASAMMGGASPATVRLQPSATPEPATVVDAWYKMVGTMLGHPAPSTAGGTARPSETARPTSGSRSAPAEATASRGETSAAAPGVNPFEAFSQMFETGQEVQAQQLAGFQSILDSVWGTVRKT